MKKQSLIGIAAALLVMPLPSYAAVMDVSVAPSGDVVNYRSWWYGGSAVWSDPSADPNIVYHSYEPGNGNVASSSLTFGISSLSGFIDDIVSATLNLDILSIWTEGRNDVGTLNTGAQVLFSEGAGVKSFDITTNLKDLLTNNATSATYTISYTGYSGFTFGSAEGRDPAFLRVTTRDSGGNNVPEPGTLLLTSLGLFALVRQLKGKVA